jgi:hypothetical protein
VTDPMQRSNEEKPTVYYSDKKEFDEDFNDTKISLAPEKCDWWKFNGVQFVEYSAYEKLKAENAELKLELKELTKEFLKACKELEL